MNLIPGKDTHLLLLLGVLVVDHGEFHLDHFWSQHDFYALLTQVSGKELDIEWGQFFLLSINIGWKAEHLGALLCWRFPVLVAATSSEFTCREAEDRQTHCLRQPTVLQRSRGQTDTLSSARPWCYKEAEDRQTHCLHQPTVL